MSGKIIKRQESGLPTMFLYYKLKATSSITEGNIRKINNEMGETCKACKRGRQTVVNLPNRAVIHGRAELRTSVFGSVTASKHGSKHGITGVFCSNEACT